VLAPAAEADDIAARAATLPGIRAAVAPPAWSRAWASCWT